MKTSFDKAERVASQISKGLGSPDWFLGIGVEPDPREGFVLSVRVLRGCSHRVSLPAQVDGVKVSVMERALARPL